jgi:hypothetical protein
MIRDLKIYQANLRKMPETQHSMMNDESLKEFSLLLLSEPHVYKDNDVWKAAPQTHQYWNPTLPNRDDQNTRPRTMIWTHKDLKARPVPTNTTDLAAALIEIQHRTILVISAYIPHKTSVADRELQERLRHIRDIVTQTRRHHTSQVELIIAGDFNRHDQLWGGDKVGLSNRQGEAAPIIELMAELDLQTPNPRGEPTWHSHDDRFSSTVDIILATPELINDTYLCAIDETEHGSDHSAIRTEMAIEWESPKAQPRKLWKKARWDQMRKRVQELLNAIPEPAEQATVDEHCEYIMKVVLPAVDDNVPLAKPSPYSKRWWTEDLTTLRKDYSYWRNRARTERRSGSTPGQAQDMANQFKKRFHDAARNQRKTHWLEFIADAENIWTVAKYMNPNQTSNFSRIPIIKVRDRSYTSEADIAQELLREFFPKPPQVIETFPGGRQREELPMEPLTEDEIERATFSSSPYKAPGADGLPAIVWQQLWPVLKTKITKLFQQSLDTGKLPKQWKTANIVPLRKGGTRNWTEAKAYRPISLLATLGKNLEAVVAERLAYLAETHNLLPKNHFGARKGRSATQALSTLQESIFQAWKEKKVLSLVSFDIKGAYNGVDIEVLAQRLRERGIPRQLVTWVLDFCTERRASVTVNNQSTPVRSLPQSGLPQGSKVSPILFLFFNADLVTSKLNRNEGAIAFVDDYTAWVTGESAEANTRKIQTDIVDRAMRWARASGATFEADKTAFVHFTRNLSKTADNPLEIDGELVKPKTEIKILGVVLDPEMRFRKHTVRLGKRGVNAALALKRIRGLSPKQARTIFISKVASVMDYASPIWSIGTAQMALKPLAQAQRIGAQAIIGAFRTVSGERAEAEAGIVPKETRWELQQGKYWSKCHTQPKKHPFWKLRRRIDTKNTRFQSPLQRIAAKFGTEDTAESETIQPYCITPWEHRLKATISEKDEAEEWARTTTEGVVYVDASFRLSNIGVGLYLRVQKDTRRVEDRQSLKIGNNERASAYYAELIAIHEAVLYIERIWEQLHQIPPEERRLVIPSVITSDCTSALQAISKPRNQSGQSIIAEIYCVAQRLRKRNGPVIRLQWIPAQSGIEGGDIAHRLAKRATAEHLPKIRHTTLAYSLRVVKKKVKPLELKKEVKIDSALPGKHVKTLYDDLKFKESFVLCQLRTDKSRLNSSLARINAIKSPNCECNRQVEETTRHFLFECPRWKTEREPLRKAAGTRWGDLSYMLGGRCEQVTPDGQPLDGPRDSWTPDIEIVRETIKFALSTGRLR